MQIGSFASRHLGPREEDQTTMLRALGAPSLDDLIERGSRGHPTARAVERVQGLDGK